MTTSLTVEPIGLIHTRYTERATTPVQTALDPDEQGRVVLEAPYRAGLHLVRVLSATGEGFGAMAGAVRSGWFDTVDLSGPHTPQSLRRK
jgi:hypothetical protein